MAKPYRIDDRPVTAQELIDAAREAGYKSPDGLFLTSASAVFLRGEGHEVETNQSYAGGA